MRFKTSNEIYSERLSRYGSSPKSVGYLIASWARYEREIMQESLQGLTGRLLDVGCGIGFVTSDLLSVFQIVGLDISLELLQLCPQHPDFAPVLGDGLQLPFRNGGFDAVICSNLLQSFEQSMGFQILEELVRTVKPNGRIVLTVRNGESMARRISAPLYRLYSSIRGFINPPLFGYEADSLSHKMTELGCREEDVGFLFPPLRLRFGRPGRHIGTTLLLIYRKNRLD